MENEEAGFTRLLSHIDSFGRGAVSPALPFFFIVVVYCFFLSFFFAREGPVLPVYKWDRAPPPIACGPR